MQYLSSQTKELMELIYQYKPNVISKGKVILLQARCGPEGG